MNATILSIGDELVLGQNVDTNSAWLSRELTSLGLRPARHLTLGDDRAEIAGALRDIAPSSDVILVTGGLGPTADDLTRHALADLLDAPLELHHDWLEHVRAFFQKLGRTMPESNGVQALIPRGAKLIWNHHGTAAGIEAQLGACRIFVMPGVPSEMKRMFERDVAPALRSIAQGPFIAQRALRTFGLGESTIAEMLGVLMERDQNPAVGTTASQGVVTVRINSYAPSAAQALAALEQTDALVRQKLGTLIFACDDETLEEHVGTLLAERELTLATAESCTGGLLAQMLTSVPGASAWFEQGWVVYANDAKTSQLDVDPRFIELHGAVSEPVVREMALGALDHAGTDFAIAISGVAGPDGGTAAKPVGTVCIALAHAGEEVQTRTFLFPGERAIVRLRAALAAMSMLRFKLLDEPMPF